LLRLIAPVVRHGIANGKHITQKYNPKFNPAHSVCRADCDLSYSYPLDEWVEGSDFLLYGKW